MNFKWFTVFLLPLSLASCSDHNDSAREAFSTWTSAEFPENAELKYYAYEPGSSATDTDENQTFTFKIPVEDTESFIDALLDAGRDQKDWHEPTDNNPPPWANAEITETDLHGLLFQRATTHFVDFPTPTENHQVRVKVDTSNGHCYFSYNRMH